MQSGRSAIDQSAVSRLRDEHDVHNGRHQRSEPATWYGSQLREWSKIERHDDELNSSLIVSPTSSAMKKADDRTMATINLVEVDELLRAML